MGENFNNVINGLVGEVLGDVLNNFSSYIVENDALVESKKEEFLKSFVPENNFQKLIKFKLIDKWQRKLELIQIFKDEDIYCATQALRCKWFFTGVDSSCTILVNEIIPNLSFSIRHKFIKQYSKHLKDVDKAEEMFDALRLRYGRECAFTILPACSPTFVNETLRNTVMQVKPIVIVQLFRLHPKLIFEYFCFLLQRKSTGERLYRKFNFDKYGQIFVQIASKYTEKFIDLYVKYSSDFPCIQLGNRISRRVVNTNFSLIIKNYNIFSKILKMKNVIKNLSISQIEELQLKNFPENLKEFFQMHWQLRSFDELILHLDEVKRQDMLLKNFKMCYGKELTVDEFGDAIDLNIILLLPTEMRIKQIHSVLPTLEPDSKKAEYMSYLPPNASISILKNMVGQQKEMTARAHMVKCMLLSCIRYKDCKSLLDCLSFIVNRLRNDPSSLWECCRVFDEYRLNMKDLLMSLSIQEWSIIDEFVDLVKLNKEVIYYKFQIRIILQVQIERYFTETLPMNDYLKKYMEFEFSMDIETDFDLCKETPYHKQCLEFFISSLPSQNFTKEEIKETIYSNLFVSLCNFNHINKGNKIDFPEWLLVVVEKMMTCDKHYHYTKDAVIKATKTQPNMRERIFLTIFPNTIDVDILRYVLRKNPNLVKKHHEEIMKKILGQFAVHQYISLFKEITLYTSFGLPQIITSYCTGILNSECSDSNDFTRTAKPNTVTVLAILMTTEDFLNIISPYKPTSKEVRDYSKEIKLKYDIQREVASSLKYIITPSKILTYIKSFAVGDYLKFVVGTINSVCLKVAENKILPLLIEWLDCPVSLRKHFIRAYYKVASTTDAGNLVVSLLANENNSSLRLVLLQHIYRYFLTEPSEESFNVFKAGYGQLSTKDVAALDDLFDLNSVPDFFIVEYVMMLWQLVENKEGPLVTKNKNKIINLIDAEIHNLLPETFSNSLLDHIFKNKQVIALKMFITDYIIFSTNEDVQSCRLTNVTKYITEAIQEWNTFSLTSSTVFQVKTEFFEIVQDLCQRSLSCRQQLKIHPANMLEDFKIFLLSLIPPSEIIEELLYLDLTIFFFSTNMKMESFVSELATFCDKTLNEYCLSYGDHTIDTMIGVMPFCLDKYHLELARLLLSQHTSYQSHIMAIKLLNTNVTSNLSTHKIIIECLLKSTHPYVKVAAASFFKHLNSNVNVE